MSERAIKPDPQRIARAKRIRDKELANTKAIYDLCACLWPLVRYRNGHGHSDDCPAVAEIQRQADERAALREECDHA